MACKASHTSSTKHGCAVDNGTAATAKSDERNDFLTSARIDNALAVRVSNDPAFMMESEVLVLGSWKGLKYLKDGL